MYNTVKQLISRSDAGEIDGCGAFCIDSQNFTDAVALEVRNGHARITLLGELQFVVFLKENSLQYIVIADGVGYNRLCN